MSVGLDVNGANIRLGHESAVDELTNAAGVAICNATQTHADAVITLDKLQCGTGGRWLIGGIFYSYAGGTLAGGRLLVQDTTNSETILDIDVSAAAKDFITYVPPLRCKQGATIVITLKDGSASVVGKLNVHAWFLL